MSHGVGDRELLVLAVGVIQNTNIIKGDLYKGGSDTLDLSSMLDNVPDDLKGAEGAAADAAGKARMAELRSKVDAENRANSFWRLLEQLRAGSVSPRSAHRTLLVFRTYGVDLQRLRCPVQPQKARALEKLIAASEAAAEKMGLDKGA